MILKRLCQTNAEIYVFLVRLPQSHYTGTEYSQNQTLSFNSLRHSDTNVQVSESCHHW